MDESYWDNIRKEFPITRNYAYFQSAGMSPMPDIVLNKVTESYRKVNLYGDIYWLEELERCNKVLAKLAAMINTKPSNIVFAHNTSTAFSFVAAALRAGKKEPFNLVSLQDEFPSSNIPFEFQGIPVKYVQSEDGIYSVDDIMQTVDENTLGVVCSYVQYATGFKLNINELGKRLHEKGLLFILNATQAFPVFDVDVVGSHVDVMTVSFHKWGLCAHVGSLFYTSERFRQNYPNPLGGWLSVHPPADDFIPVQKGEGYTQYKDANQYNFGTMNFQAVSGLEAALDYMEQTGRENIRQRIFELTSYLIEKLSRLPVRILTPIERAECRSGIILVDLLSGNNEACVEFLKQNNVITCIRSGKIRISCNFFNNFRDVENLAEALNRFLERG
jgi:cysteine desulfurase / selenocysteine lyase